MTLTAERYPYPETGQPELHVVDGGDGQIEIWLNTGVADFDGLCIGYGNTRDEAIASAVAVLEWAAEVLNGPPPDVARRLAADAEAGA